MIASLYIIQDSKPLSFRLRLRPSPESNLFPFKLFSLLLFLPHSLPSRFRELGHVPVLYKPDIEAIRSAQITFYIPYCFYRYLGYILSFYIPNDLASFLLYEFPVVARYRSFSFIDSIKLTRMLAMFNIS